MNDNKIDQVFLVLSDKSSDKVLENFNELSLKTKCLGESVFLFHQKSEHLPINVSSINHFIFTNSVLSELNYKPIGSTLVPGNNHFPLLKFYLENPNYQYYWNIEDDVCFNGDWSILFDYYSKCDSDFISCYVENPHQNPHWYWWYNLFNVGALIPIEERLKSFNPIYRVSNRALALLNKSLLMGWQGHHEILMPTLFHSEGLSITDMRGWGHWAYGKKAFYTEDTMSHIPLKMGSLNNKIYHPIKYE